MTENEERFLREIVARIPLSAIEEVHMFAPLRQTGAESGVAVVAVGEEASAGGGEPAAETQAESRGETGGENLQQRYTVYTARYRHTFKGPERGRWEFDMAVDADAPLLTIDRVVSGVLQRSGEQGEPVRLSAGDVLAAIGDINWTATK